jgi:ABC-type transport system involved in multi-copper enzyme maturation permease subunit
MITAFTRFDVRNAVTTQPRRLLIPLLLVAVTGFVLPVPGMPMVIGAVMGSLLVSYPFQADERGHLDTLYATTPVTPRAVVVGRYLTVLAVAAVAVLVGAATTFAVSAVNHRAVDPVELGAVAVAAVAIVVLACAVQLPVYFALGYTKARPMMFVPVIVIAVGAGLLGRTDAFDGLLDGPVPPLAPVAVAVVVGGAVLLTVSAVIAERVYRRREF